MDYFNVNFLNVVGIIKVWYVNFDICCVSYFVVVFIGQGDYFYFFFMCCCDCFDYVCRVIGGGDFQQYIVFVIYCFNVVGENIIEIEIIIDVGNMINVRNSNCWVVWMVFMVVIG